ncbi:hypothetical protein LTR10_008929 [Elasticomyces elasticus]|nr:hypothetical protein LTR10_008929 [Elasticomyces elasticus]KAK4964840.1 hypothetical protein LTR42_012787 [Elasticomyces elasticus]
MVSSRLTIFFAHVFYIPGILAFGTIDSSSSTAHTNLTTSGDAIGSYVAAGLGISSTSSLEYSSTSLHLLASLSRPWNVSISTSIPQNAEIIVQGLTSTTTPGSHITSPSRNASITELPASEFAVGNSTTLDNATQCLTKIAAWVTRNNIWLSQAGHVSNITTTWVDHSRSSPSGYSPNKTAYTTLCDGWPRAHGDWYTLAPYTSSSVTTTILATYTEPAPQCSLENSECSTWWTRSIQCASAIYSLADQQPSGTSAPKDCSPYTITPPCPQPSNFERPSNCRLGGLSTQYDGFWEADVRLHYWPVTTTHADNCSRSGLTVTDTTPRSAVISGTIIVSPNVAVEISAASAWDSCGIIDPVVKNMIVTLPPQSIRSVVPPREGVDLIFEDPGVPLNYGDLPPNKLLASKWFNQRTCGQELDNLDLFNYAANVTSANFAATVSHMGLVYPECGTIWDEGYQPQLVIPSSVLGMPSQWSKCAGYFGIYDPPRILTEVTSAEAVTTPVQEISSEIETATPLPTVMPVQQTTARESSTIQYTSVAIASAQADPTTGHSAASSNAAPLDPPISTTTTPDILPSTSDSTDADVSLGQADPTTVQAAASRSSSTDPLASSTRLILLSSTANLPPSQSNPGEPALTIQDPASAITSVGQGIDSSYATNPSTSRDIATNTQGAGTDLVVSPLSDAITSPSQVAGSDPSSPGSNPAGALVSLLASQNVQSVDVSGEQVGDTSSDVGRLTSSTVGPSKVSTSADALGSVAPSVVSSSALIVGGITFNPVAIASTSVASGYVSVTSAAIPAMLYIIGDQTLTAGSSITIGSGSATTIVALQTDSTQTYLVVDSSTSRIAQQAATASYSALVLTLGGIVASPIPKAAPTESSDVTGAASESSSSPAAPVAQYVVGDQTLKLGSTITIGSGSATTIAALNTDSDVTYLVVGSSTSRLAPQSLTEMSPALTISSSIVTADTNSNYLIGSQTLVPGGHPITVSGTVISLASGATEVVVGTSSARLGSGMTSIGIASSSPRPLPGPSSASESPAGGEPSTSGTMSLQWSWALALLTFTAAFGMLA